MAFNMSGALAGLAGAGGPGGAFNPQTQIQNQELQKMQQQKQQEAALAQAMKQYAGQQQAQNPGGQQKPPDPMQMLDMLSQAPIGDDQKYEAWQNYTKSINPIDKLQNQFDLGMQKIDAARARLEDQQGFLLKLQNMKDSTSRANTQDRVGATERGQDMNSANVDKRLDTTERGQDIMSEDRNRDIGRKIVSQEENNKVRQQNADTATDRANTSKEGMLLKDKRAGEAMDFKKLALKEKNDLIVRGQDKQYQERMANIASKGTPEQKAEFDAAKAEFTQASADYRNAKISMNSSAADIAAQADKALAAQQKMEQSAAKVQGSREPAKPVEISPEDITPENLEHTAKVNGITVDEVKKRLGIQ